MLRSLLRSTLLVALLAPVAGAQTTIVGAANGLASPNTVLTFNGLGVSEGTPITNQLSGFGVSFSNAYFAPAGSVNTGPAFGSDALFNSTVQMTYAQIGALTIAFAQPVTGAAFNLLTFEQFATEAVFANIEFFSGNTSLASFMATSPQPTANQKWWGFFGVEFDRIVISAGNPNAPQLGIDNLQVAMQTVPEPSAVLLLGAGLGAVALVARRRKRR